MTAPLDAAARLLGDRAERNVPIGAMTTYRVGGSAALLVEGARTDELVRLAEIVGSTGVDVLVIGRGSNLLVTDSGFDGLAITLHDELAAVEIEGTTVRAGGAASLPVVARRTAKAGLTGFEWAVGVPGSIGGAVRMNAGGHGSDMSATLTTIRVVDLRTGEDVEVSAAALELGYRHSTIAPHQVVVRADLALTVGDRAASEALIAEIVAWRRENQPGGQNAGSVFTNPLDDSAGRLIDLAGCKGLRIGSAEVSAKHANFIQADDGGSADDVLTLMGVVAARVLAATGIALVPETRIVGRDPRPGIEGSA